MIKIERFKSLFLFLLVVVSIAQTATLWTYRPSGDPIEQEQTSLNQIDASKTLEGKQITYPEQSVYTAKGESYATRLSGRTILSRIGASFNIGSVSLTDKATVIPSSERVVEIDFASPVSAGMISDLIGEKKIAMEESVARVHLLEYDGPILRLETETGRFKDFHLNGDDAVLKRLFAYDKKQPFRKITLESGRYFYAPSGTLRLEELLVYDDVESSPTPMNRIRAAFFPDNPNVQQIRSREGQDVLTDGVSAATYDRSYNAFRFNTLSPSAQSSSDIDYASLVNYVNIHGGWLERSTQKSGFQFYYDGTQRLPEAKKRTTFRLHLGKYPVFATTGTILEMPNFDLATIVMTYDENQVRSLSRGFLRSDRKLVLREKLLPSIDRVVADLRANEMFSQVEEIKIGYQMTYTASPSRYAFLEPAWFVERDGDWDALQYTQNEAQGKVMFNGLE
ncbi:two-component system activity regulator YycH [Exiguobacterium flavidum]|uniref:two-component system activity regulator YycH n=1 Tax=Exiguobacterium flavidum TaxID=2184695 RepID=UPI000DF77C8B|nr:two-component system activity regulator YycH [Exiguobacterium flavidum]